MTTDLAIRSIIELAAILLLIYGFYKEDKVIAFERKLKIILVVNYRRYKRKKKAQQLRKNPDFRVVNGGSHHKPDGSFHVA